MKRIEQIAEILKTVISPDSSIGVHGISDCGDSAIATADSILENGLKNNGWGGILSNVAMFGTTSEVNWRDIDNYAYGICSYEEPYVKLLVAVPNTLRDAEGNEYYLGEFRLEDVPKIGYAKGNYENPINRAVEQMKLLPSEFIVGYFVCQPNSDLSEFVLNPNYIGLKTEEEKVRFFETIKATLIENRALPIEEESTNKILSIIEVSKRFKVDLKDTMTYYTRLLERIKEKNKKQQTTLD